MAPDRLAGELSINPMTFAFVFRFHASISTLRVSEVRSQPRRPWNSRRLKIPRLGYTSSEMKTKTKKFVWLSPWLQFNLSAKLTSQDAYHQHKVTLTAICLIAVGWAGSLSDDGLLWPLLCQERMLANWWRLIYGRREVSLSRDFLKRRSTHHDRSTSPDASGSQNLRTLSKHTKNSFESWTGARWRKRQSGSAADDCLGWDRSELTMTVRYVQLIVSPNPTSPAAEIQSH